MLPGQQPGQKGFEDAKKEATVQDILQMKKEIEDSGLYQEGGLVESLQKGREMRQEMIRKNYLAALNSVQGLPPGSAIKRFNHAVNDRTTWEIAEVIFPCPQGFGVFPCNYCLAWIRGAPCYLTLEDQKTFDPMFFCYYQAGPNPEGFGPTEEEAREIVRKKFDAYWTGPQEYVLGKGMVDRVSPESDSPEIR